MKEEILFVEKLDFGFVVTQNSKTKAVNSYATLEEMIKGVTDKMTDSFHQVGMNDMMIKISVDFNLPKAK